jgi:hypothetical protein
VFEIEAKSPVDDRVYYDYIYDCQQSRYSTIDTQEWDFDTISSSLNTNCTGVGEGFCPGVLYAPA